MKKSLKETTTKEVILEINAKDIINLLILSGQITGSDKVDVYFRVPGGGDWSNTSIEISNEYPITVRAKKTVEK